MTDFSKGVSASFTFQLKVPNDLTYKTFDFYTDLDQNNIKSRH